MNWICSDEYITTVEDRVLADFGLQHIANCKNTS